jgi:hypothetical protein
VAFPSDRIFKTTKDVNVLKFPLYNNSCKLYQRIPGTFWSFYVCVLCKEAGVDHFNVTNTCSAWYDDHTYTHTHTHTHTRPLLCLELCSPNWANNEPSGRPTCYNGDMKLWADASTAHGICDGQSGAGKDFFLSTSVFPYWYHSNSSSCCRLSAILATDSIVNCIQHYPCVSLMSKETVA